jgi:hypothetical protein
MFDFLKVNLFNELIKFSEFLLYILLQFGLLKVFKSLFLSFSNDSIDFFLKFGEFIHYLQEELFVKLQNVAVTPGHVGIMSEPVHDDVSLPEDRPLQVVLVLIHTLYTALQQKEDLAGGRVLPGKDRHPLDAHGLELVQEVAVEPHLSVLQQLNLSNGTLIQEFVDLCLQVRGKNV